MRTMAFRSGMVCLVVQVDVCSEVNRLPAHEPDVVLDVVLRRGAQVESICRTLTRPRFW